MDAVFYIRAVYNAWETKQQGRPIYDDKVYCKYRAGGNTLLEMDVPSTNVHENRFHRQWAKFQAGHGADAQRATGTPLDQWPILTPSAIEELKGLKFYSIDQIAAASDQQLQVLGMGFLDMGPFTLRTRAKAYLDNARDSALPQAQAAEMAALKAEMAEKDAKHAQEMADLRALILANAPNGGVQKRKRRTKAEMLADTTPVETAESEENEGL